MKELELLKILTNVKNEYILEAQELRSGQRKRQLHLVRRKRLFLIAAVLSMLLLAGCAAVLVGLQKISMGRVTFPQYSQPGWTMDLVSSNGYVDSVNYRATREWLDFITSYDKDRALEQEKDANSYTALEDYRVYNCYTPQMQEKVDEICQKYGLQLAGPVYFTGEPEEVFPAVGIPSMMHNSDMFSLSGSLYYRSGSFSMVGMVEHCFEGRSTSDSILFTYTCDRKSIFFPDYVILRDMDTVDSWEYTAWDGTDLILVQSPTRGVIAADAGDFFISVTLDFRYSSPEGEVDAHNPCSREDFEWIADDFTYQISPQEPEQEWLAHPNGLNSVETQQTYADYFDNWLPGSLGSEAYSPDYQQKFVDLDEDGTDEMLIWNTRTGVVYEVVTKVNGAPYCVYGGGTYGADDHTVDMYLCEGNTLEKDLGDLQGKQLSEYYRLEEGQLLLVETVMEGMDGRFYWSESGGASSVMWTEITEGEYQALRAKYVRIGVPKAPSSEEVQEIRESEEAILWRVLQNQEPFFAMSSGTSCTLSEYCGNESERMGFDVSITRYALVDMDGDSVREAVVDFRFGENSQVMCMVLKYESHNTMVSGTEFYTREMSQIKEDGSFAYSGGGDNDGWGKLRWGNYRWVTKTVEDSSGKADVSWYSYPVSEG